LLLLLLLRAGVLLLLLLLAVSWLPPCDEGLSIVLVIRAAAAGRV
jgi:hypothetical protein